MTQMYDYGFFIDNNHINTFTNFLTQLYDDNLEGSSWSYIPSNEVAYLYAISAILKENINDSINNFQDVINIMDYQSDYFSREDDFIHKLAVNCLMKQINIDIREGLPEEYSVVIKTMIDLLTNEYDLVMDKKFEMMSYVRYQLEKTRESFTRINYEYDLER